MQDFIGQTIHGYEVREQIGMGGNGVIYKAFQPAVNREVAIKVIRPDFVGDSEFIHRFEGEVRLIARLEHPHIVPIYDFWHDEQGLFLVMRYLRGGSLRQALQQQGPLALTFVVRIVEQISDALATAHAAGVIHRDIKPDNILLDDRGNVYLSDFGLAKSLQATSYIDSNILVGTPAYISPEQVRGEGLSYRADIYSFGVVLYELLTGVHPFPGASMGMLFSYHVNEPLPRVCAKRPELPSRLDTVIQRATEKNPLARHPDMPMLAAEFRSAAESSADSAAVAKTQGVVDNTVNHANRLDKRYRANMLQNVQNFWIEGVLSHALHDSMLINIGMEYDSKAVKTPVNALMKRPTLPDRMFVSQEYILDIFDKLNGKLLILGNPGGGKTTILLELTRALLLRAHADDAHPIPVVLNLSSWVERRKPLEEWLVKELIEKYEAPPAVAQKWVEDDLLTLLLDGLDEVSEKYRNDCVETINLYRRDHGLVDVVVCSRTQDYSRLTYQLTLNGAIVVRPLDNDQIDSYLASIGAETETLKTAFEQDKTLMEMSRSPLMLTIMARVYREGADLFVSNLPKAEREEALRKRLFREYIDYTLKHTLIERSEGHAYSKETILRYLSTLAWQMTGTEQVVFYVEALKPIWLPSESLILLQRNLAFVIQASIFSIAFFVVESLILGSLAQNIFNMFLYMGGMILVFSRLILSSGEISRENKTLPIGFTQNRKLQTSLSLLNEKYSIVAAICGLITFAATLPNGIVVAFVSTFLAIIAAFVMVITMSDLGGAFVQHYVLRFVMFVNRLLPLRFSRFLDYATSLTLLQKVGSGYIFMHRYLLEYFVKPR